MNTTVSNMAYWQKYYISCQFANFRIACCESAEMSEFFIRAETALFAYRISCMTEREMLHTIKLLQRYHNAIKNTAVDTLPLASSSLVHMYYTMEYATLKSSWEILVKDYMSGSNKMLMVPFESVLDLVSKRQVLIHNGFALLPVTKLCDLLVPLFRTMLVHSVKVARRKWRDAGEDSRMKRLMCQLTVECSYSITS